MSSSSRSPGFLRARSIAFTDTALTIELVDGKTVSAPLDWYPRLAHATVEERGRWRLIGNGFGVHWPDLDEDVSVENVVAQKPSREGPQSFQRWLQLRTTRGEC